MSSMNLLLMFDCKLQVLADHEAQEVDLIEVGMNFCSYLYCGKAVESHSNMRFTLFSKK